MAAALHRITARGFSAPIGRSKKSLSAEGWASFIAASNAADLKGRLTLSDKPDKKTGRLHEFVLELPDSAVVP